MARGRSGPLLVGAVLAAGLMFLRPKRASAATVPDVQLSPHFRLSEFLRSSRVPELARYQPTTSELANVRALAVDVLEPLRAQFGPVLITGGGRPDSVRNAAGQTLTEALLKDPTDPVARSAAAAGDHPIFAGADVVLPKLSTVDQYRSAYEALRSNPRVRQVVLELATDKAGRTTISHLHVAVVLPGRPRLSGERFAYVAVDGKRLEKANA